MCHDVDPPLALRATCAKSLNAAELLAQVRPVVHFLKEEIEQSSELLRQLAVKLTAELRVLSEANDLHMVEASVFRMSEVLQNEDRIQQRLSDINSALGIVDRSFHPAHAADHQHLSVSIMEQLKLDEMQFSLAIKADIHDSGVTSRSMPTPSLGEVDLF